MVRAAPMEVVELAMEVLKPVEVVMAVAAEDSRTKPPKDFPSGASPWWGQPLVGPAPRGSGPQPPPLAALQLPPATPRPPALAPAADRSPRFEPKTAPSPAAVSVPAS